MNSYTQAALLRNYNDTHREHFNEEFFNKDDNEIIEALKKVILSCQRERFFILKVKNFTVVDNYDEIRKILRKDEAERNKNKGSSFVNIYDCVNLKSSAIKLLVVDYYIETKNENAKPEDKCADVRVIIAVPRLVNKYYFKINGNLYSTVYQIVDGSTYNNSFSKSNKNKQNVTFKTMFMASRLFRYNNTIEDTTGAPVKCIHYQSNIFKKSIPVLKYLLGKYGFYYTKSMLMIDEIYLSNSDPRDDNMYTFNKHNVFISVPKFMYDNDTVLESLVYTLLMSIAKDTTVEDLYTREFWLKSLGEAYNSKTVEKGEAILDSLEFIYDIPAEEAIRLPQEDKDDIYKIIVWLVREFNELRQKDNLNVGTKRLRWSEYIAALYATKLCNGILRISDEGYKVTLKSIMSAIKIAPDFLIRTMTKDRLVNCCDAVNDNDAPQVLKYTYKGLHGLGEGNKSKSSIAVVYRQVHPSQAGRLDINSATATDPGLSGMLCPMVKIYDNSFSDQDEPNNWREDIGNIMAKYNKLKGYREVIKFQEISGLPVDNDQKEGIDETLAVLDNLLYPIAYASDKNDMLLEAIEYADQ